MATTLPFSTPSEARLARRPPSDPNRIAAPERILMWLIVAASAVGGAVVHAHPTASTMADSVLTAAFAGLIALAGAYARRWSWLVAAGVAVIATNGGIATACAVASVLVGFLAVAMNVRSRAMGATALALAAQALLRLPDFSIHGAPSLVAVAAVVPVAVSGYRYAPRRSRRLIRRSAKYAVGVAIVIAGIAVFTGLRARSNIDDGIQHAQAGFDAIGNGDRDTAVAELQQAASAFRSAANLAGGWWTAPIRATPIAGQQLAAVTTMAEQGRNLSSAGSQAAGAVDYEQLRVKGGAIDLGLVQSATPAVQTTASALGDAARRLDRLTTDWLVPPIRDKFDLLSHEVHRALPAANIARDVVTVAPEILGATTPQHYLVLFGSPSETRELGGFVGNFAEVTADHGKLSLTRTGRSLDLSDPSGNHGYTLRDGAYQEPFVPYRVNQFFGNVSASANFADVADVAMQLYPQVTGQQIDGVFYMDPYALAALLDLTGPITLKDGNVKLNAKNAAHELLVDQYTQLTVKKERVDFLDEATRVTFEKLTSGDLPKPARIADTLNPMVDQGRMFGYSAHPDVNALFQELALDGDAPAPNGDDLLWVTQTNENPSKIDAYLQRDIKYEADVRPDTGQVDANVTIKLTNSAPADGLPVDVIGNGHDQPPGTNHMFLTVYSALHASSASVDDQPVGVGATPRFGLSAYTVILDVPAGQTVTVNLTLSGTIGKGDDYRLKVVRQPTVNPDNIDVTVVGRSGWKVVGTSGKATIGPDRVTDLVTQLDGP